jgi:hypothetical protein
MKIWSISSHSKIYNFFLSKFFYQKFCIYILIFLIYHIFLSLYKISQIKTIHKNACIKRHKQKNNSYFSNSKMYYHIFGAYMLYIFI